jgi:hypothetical protein
MVLPCSKKNLTFSRAYRLFIEPHLLKAKEQDSDPSEECTALYLLHVEMRDCKSCSGEKFARDL